MSTYDRPTLADVIGATVMHTSDEELPCGTGRTYRWLDAEGNVLRQDYTVFVKEGVLTSDATAQQL